MPLARPEVAKAGALKIANRVRARMGFPPVDHLYPGVIQNGERCPITETIYDDDVDRAAWRIFTGPFSVNAVSRVDGKGVTLSISSTRGAASFIRMFDSKQFPELEVSKD